MVIKYTNIFNSKALKIYTNCYFWYKNHLHSNPGHLRLVKVAHQIGPKKSFCSTETQSCFGQKSERLQATDCCTEITIVCVCDGWVWPRAWRSVFWGGEEDGEACVLSMQQFCAEQIFRVVFFLPPTCPARHVLALPFGGIWDLPSAVFFPGCFFCEPDEFFPATGFEAATDINVFLPPVVFFCVGCNHIQFCLSLFDFVATYVTLWRHACSASSSMKTGTCFSRLN
jgi:hypothetical protein